MAVHCAQRSGGPGRDPCEVLAEQQEYGSGGADVQGQASVGQALLEEFPVGVVVDPDGIGLGPVRDEKRAAVAAAGGPDDEVANLVAGARAACEQASTSCWVASASVSLCLFMAVRNAVPHTV